MFYGQKYIPTIKIVAKCVIWKGLTKVHRLTKILNQIKYLYHSHLLFLLSHTRVDWKVHRLTKILIWNVTKWGLFLNILPPSDSHTFSMVLQGLNPIGKKSHQQLVWCHYIHFSVHPYIYIYIYIYVYMSIISSHLPKTEQSSDETESIMIFFANQGWFFF